MSLAQFSLRFLRLAFSTTSQLSANLSATAIDQQRYREAALWLAAAAVTGAATSSAEYYLDGPPSEKAIDELRELSEQRGGLREALKAIADGDIVSPGISAKRAADFLELIDSAISEDALSPPLEELVIHVGTWLERWCEKHQTTVDQFVLKVDAEFAGVNRKLDQLIAVADSPVLTAEDLAQRFVSASRPLSNWPKSLSDGTTIDRPEVESLRSAIGSRTTNTIALLGPPGAGKSALLAMLDAALRAEGTTVLSIKADTLPTSIQDPTALSNWLGTAMPIDEALRLLAKRGTVVLLLDQLDALSELADRKSERLNVLLNLIHAVADRTNVHVVMACREFEFRHDVRLTTITAERIELQLPAWAAISKILADKHHDPERMSTEVQELLRTPLHLKIFLDVAQPDRLFGSLQSLLDTLWFERVTDPKGVPGRIKLLETLAARMADDEALWVPRALADDAPDARDALITADILCPGPTLSEIGFRHQTYYDYTMSRAFARGTVGLSDYVCGRQDGLFIRPVLLSSLQYLRVASRPTYHREILKLFQNARLHVRTLLLEFVAQQSDPDLAEVGLLRPVIPTPEGPLIMRAAGGSKGWLQVLRDSPELAYWLRKEPDEAALAVDFLTRAAVQDPEGILTLLKRHWAHDAKYDKLLFAVAQHNGVWDEGWVNLLCDVARRCELGVFWSAASVAERQPELAPRLVIAQLEREFEAAERTAASQPPPQDETDLAALFRHQRQDPFRRLLDSNSHDRYSLKDVAAAAPSAFLRTVWPWFEKVLEKVAWTTKKSGQYHEDHATWMHYTSQPLELIESLHVAASGWAKTEPEDFAKFIRSAGQAEFLASHRILCQAIASAPTHLAEVAADYLSGDPRRLMIGDHYNEHRHTQELIRAIVPLLTPESRARLEAAVVACDPYKDDFAGRPAKDRFDFKKYARQHRLRLLRAFPDQYLSDAARALKLSEETQLPPTNDDDSRIRSGSVGPRVTTEEMLKASDEQILGLIDSLKEQEKHGRVVRWDVEIERSGGTDAQAGAFSSFAENSPKRAMEILEKIAVDDVGAQYAAAAVGGLSRSALSSPEFLTTVRRMQDRGFDSTRFREAVARAVEDRAGKREFIPPDVLNQLEEWLDTTAEPQWPREEDTQADTAPHRGAIVFRHGIGLVSFLHGRGTLSRAISAVYSAQDPVDVDNLIRVLRTRVGREPHAGVLAEMLHTFRDCFARSEEAAAVYDEVVHSCPQVLTEKFWIITLAELSGRVRPDTTYERWLERLGDSSSPFDLQAYGELLFLYYARRGSGWAATQIEAALSADTPVLVGIAYGAAEGWRYQHCRPIATKVLVAAAHRADAK